MELKEMLLFIRKRTGLTQLNIGRLIGTNQTEISFMERGFIPEDTRKIEIIKSLYKRIKKNGNCDYAKSLGNQ